MDLLACFSSTYSDCFNFMYANELRQVPSARGTSNENPITKIRKSNLSSHRINLVNSKRALNAVCTDFTALILDDYQANS